MIRFIVYHNYNIQHQLSYSKCHFQYMIIMLLMPQLCIIIIILNINYNVQSDIEYHNYNTQRQGDYYNTQLDMFNT